MFFGCLVSLPDEYPGKKPKVSIQSIYNYQDNKCLRTELVKEFAYQPGMDFEIQVKELKYVNYLTREVTHGHENLKMLPMQF